MERDKRKRSKERGNRRSRRQPGNEEKRKRKEVEKNNPENWGFKEERKFE